jgi:hypothetical protein
MSKWLNDRRADRRSGHPGRAAAARAAADGGPGSRGSWLRSRWAAIQLSVLTLAVVGVVIVLGDNDNAEADRTDDLVTRLEEQESARDREQIEQLTATGRQATALVDPLVTQLSSSPPAGELTLTDATVDRRTVAGWARTARRARGLFGDPESASTGINVARGALVGAIDAVNGAVRAYDDGLALPEGLHQTAALTRASESLDLAVRLWSVAASQIDELNVRAGFGHQHIHLAVATPPDSQREGTGAS